MKQGPIDRDTVLTLISDIPDPCTVATGVPIGISDMGLIKDVTCHNGHVAVTMQLTSPVCMMFAYFIRSIEERLMQHPGIESVLVDVDEDLSWTPAMMTAEGRARLRQQQAPYLRRLLADASQAQT